MMATEDQGQLEKAKAEQIIAETPLMDGINGVTVELGEDHTGDPAMWLIFQMQPGVNPTDVWLQRFNEFSGKLGLKLIDSGLTRFPYTRLRNAA
ncbi:MAG: hypothetical protein V4555_11120 [Acidobacteriota bacterium]